MTSEPDISEFNVFDPRTVAGRDIPPRPVTPMPSVHTDPPIQRVHRSGALKAVAEDLEEVWATGSSRQLTRLDVTYEVLS